MAEQQLPSFIKANEKHSTQIQRRPVFRLSFSPHQRASSPPALGVLCPLTSAPFGHDNQRRHAEQDRLAARYPATAPPDRRRHPAGDRPSSVYHDTDRRESERTGDIILGILHPGYIRSRPLPLPAPRQKYMTSLRCFKGASVDGDRTLWLLLHAAHLPPPPSTAVNHKCPNVSLEVYLPDDRQDIY